MKFIADSNIPYLKETFSHHGDIRILNGRDICNADLADADVLLVRSVTQVNEQLLHGTGIRFVGSMTIGIDHLDTAWLDANKITWAHAPGCNADSAAQYALAMMWLACERSDREFRQQRVGIIGRGNVGGRLQRLLTALGVPVVACDPPLQDKGVEQLVSMREACDNSIISLHVPLTTTGDHPTKNLLDRELLRQLLPGTLLVNTSRGAVIERSGLLEQLGSGRLQAALDVWPDEPFISGELLDAVHVATPHVAGYSLEGKLAGTEMIYASFCEAFSLQPSGSAVPNLEDVILDFPDSMTAEQVLTASIKASCPVSRDDSTLRAAPRIDIDDDRVQIDSLRANYPVRREFKSHKVPARPGSQYDQMRQLGFKVV